MKGNLLMLVGCLGACFYNVYCKRLMGLFDELDVLTYTYLTTTPLGLIIVALTEPDAFARLAGLDARGWLAFAFLAIVVLGLSMILFFAVLKSLPVTVALASTYMTPLFGVVLAMLLFGERLTATTAIGAILVLGATALVMRSDAAPRATRRGRRCGRGLSRGRRGAWRSRDGAGATWRTTWKSSPTTATCAAMRRSGIRRADASCGSTTKRASSTNTSPRPASRG